MTQLLQAFIVTHRDLIIARTQERVASRSPHAAPALAHGVSTFVDQLTTSLGPDTADRSPRMTGSSESRQTIGASAALHGLELLKEGFTVSQVVHAYGDICQVVTGLAAELDSSISAEDFHVFNRCLDDAIAGAVTAFGGHRETAISDAGTVRIGSLAHEMRNLLNTAQLSFTVLKEGHVGFSGSTAAVHARSLAGLSTLLTRVLADVRVEAGAERLQAHSLLEIVEDLEVAASLQAEAAHVRLSVGSVDPAIVVMADRALLESAITNLLQNAIKFTRRGGLVTLTATVAEEQVRIEVRDECGGLPLGKIDSLFLPFKQESSDRSGVGLGLSIAQRAVRAHRGVITARDIPGEGCVFRIALPRHHPAVVESKLQ